MNVLQIGDKKSLIAREEVKGIAGNLEISKEKAIEIAKARQNMVIGIAPGTSISVFDITAISDRNRVLICPNIVEGGREYIHSIRICKGIMTSRLLNNNSASKIDKAFISNWPDIETSNICNNIINNVLNSYIVGKYSLSKLNNRNEVYDNLVLVISTDRLADSTDGEWIRLGVVMSNNFKIGRKLIAEGYDTVIEANKIIEELVSNHAVITQIYNGIITAVAIK